MRRGARSVTTRSLCLAVPGAMALLLSGCAGVGNYLDSTINPFGDPNAPQGYALNMQRVRGNDVAVQPIRPQPGDVWPGPVRPVPTLSEIQQHMNVPLGQEYQNQYGTGSGNAPATYSVPLGAVPRRLAPEHRPGAAGTNAGTTKFGGYGHAVTGSSTPPPSSQTAMPNAAAAVAVKPTPAPAISAGKGFAVGETLMSPAGPAGVVTGASNGRYQTVAPINGQGGGILIPNGNGTATLIQPDGQVVTVQGQ
ncbi:hypothetical protein [Acidiphilium iwatense]|uniref:Lipoprotein n=1 Tax=Acidiphilium iwatense TaxID=768198 RepID=A0ABS9DYU0_9PROT|nr:hypothetical protein [Acidiphilium iwatense]MCF3947929.1 hypothetical protein [Acidiphilium iwatense]